MDKYQLLAQKWAFFHVHNIFDAEEIVQESFVEAYFRLDTLRQPHKFGNWFRRIVTNTAISWLRRSRFIVSFEHKECSLGPDRRAHECFDILHEAIGAKKRPRQPARLDRLFDRSVDFRQAV